MEKGKLILLIDDNNADNDYHHYVINDADASAKVQIIDDSRDALAFFENCFSANGDGSIPIPDIVFLDINMPAMNGFELLDKMRQLPDPHGYKKAMKIFMLTGSLNPDDHETATNKYHDLVTGYRIKPLTIEMLQETIGSS